MSVLVFTKDFQYTRCICTMIFFFYIKLLNAPTLDFIAPQKGLFFKNCISLIKWKIPGVSDIGSVFFFFRWHCEEIWDSPTAHIEFPVEQKGEDNIYCEKQIDFWTSNQYVVVEHLHHTTKIATTLLGKLCKRFGNMAACIFSYSVTIAFVTGK